MARSIMNISFTRNLNFARKFLLATARLAVGTPIVIGLLHVPAIQGQSQSPAAASPPLEFEVASIKPNKSREPWFLRPARPQWTYRY